MKDLLTILLLTFFSLFTHAQERYFTKSGVIRFESKAPLENIEAVNRSAVAVLDRSTGALQFSVNIKGFEFKKALMQEHFNENYLESDKYPKSEFKGRIAEMPATEGFHNVAAVGKMTIHGVTKDVTIPGKLSITKDNVSMTGVFNITLSDYNISIPAIVRDKISRTVTVSVDCTLIPLK